MGKRRLRQTPWAIVLLVLLVCCAAAFGIGKMGSNALAGDTIGHAKAVNIANIQDLQTVKLKNRKPRKQRCQGVGAAVSCCPPF